MATAAEVLQTVATNLAGVHEFVEFVAAFLGVVWIGRGTYRIATYHGNRQSGESVTSGFYNWAAGAALVSFSALMSSQSSTIFGTDEHLRRTMDYTTLPANETAALMTVLVAFITLYGYIGIIKGWAIMNALSKAGGGRQNDHIDGLVHLVCGTIAANFTYFTDVIAASVGVNNFLRDYIPN